MLITLTLKRDKGEFAINPDLVILVSTHNGDTVVGLSDGSNLTVMGTRAEVTAKLNGEKPVGSRRLVEKIDGELTLGDRVKDVEERVKILMEQRAIHGTTLNEHHSRIGDLEVAETRMGDVVLKLNERVVNLEKDMNNIAAVLRDNGLKHKP